MLLQGYGLVTAAQFALQENSGYNQNYWNSSSALNLTGIHRLQELSKYFTQVQSVRLTDDYAIPGAAQIKWLKTQTSPCSPSSLSDKFTGFSLHTAQAHKTTGTQRQAADLLSVQVY